MIRTWSVKCLHCRQREQVELLEAWEGGEFLFTACCEGLYEDIVASMQDDPEYRAWLMRELGVEEVVESKLRRIPACDDGVFRLDFNLEVKPIERDEARAFVDRHHAHNKAPVSWRYGAGIWNGRQLIGVVMVGRPVARMLDGSTIVEVNRLCIRRDIARELAWNACSQLYGWAAREAKRRGFAKIITYTLETEPGTTLKAAGWQPEARTKGGSWNRPSRGRLVVAPTCPKIRWSRILGTPAAVELKAAA